MVEIWTTHTDANWMQSILSFWYSSHQIEHSTENSFSTHERCVRLPFIYVWDSEIFCPIFNLLAYYFRSYLTINYRFIAHLVDAFDQKFINVVVIAVVDFLFDGLQIKCLTLVTFAYSSVLHLIYSTQSFISFYPPLPNYTMNCFFFCFHFKCTTFMDGCFAIYRWFSFSSLLFLLIFYWTSFFGFVIIYTLLLLSDWMNLLSTLYLCVLRCVSIECISLSLYICIYICIVYIINNGNGNKVHTKQPIWLNQKCDDNKI